VPFERLAKAGYRRGVIRRPAVILLILTGLNLLNYVDRTVLAAVLKRIQAPDALDLNDLQGGTLATAFLIGYFVTSPLFGALADRNPRWRTKLMTLGVLVWSAATFFTGRVHGYHAMLAVRALVGVGEASYASVAPTLIDEMPGKERKGRLLAVFYLAIPVGSALGYMLGGFLEARLGWRGAFYVVGGPGALLALSCLLIAPETATATATETETVTATATAMVRSLLKRPLYVGAVLGYCAQTFALGGFSYWAPKYIAAHYEVPLDHANYVFGAVLIASGLLGTGIGGVWADRLTRKKAKDEAVKVHLWICAISGLLGAPFALACILASTATGFFALIFVSATFLFLSTSPINAAILQSVPVALRASAMAVSIFAIHLLGDLWSPPLVGVIADHSTMQKAMLLLPLAIFASGVVWWGTKRMRGPLPDAGHSAP
jgi:MFS family permease